MALDEDKLILDLKLGVDGVKNQLASLESELSSRGNKLAKTFSASFKGALTIAGAVAGALGISSLVSTMKDAVKAASDQQDAINKLNASLASTGQFSESASKAIQDFASQRQELTRFGDEVTLQAASLIQTLGKLDTEGLKRATVAAQDLSAALGIDLQSAAMIVGKAAEGNVSSLQRYGLEIKKGATNAETFANALTKIEQAFGGRAIADANTFSGAVQKLRNNFGDLLEKIGDAIIKSPALISVINSISKLIVKIGDKISKSFNSEFIDRLIISALQFGVSLTNLLKPLEVIYNLLKSIGLAGFSVLSFLASGFFELQSKIVGVFSFLIEQAAKIAGVFSPELAQQIRNSLVTPLEEVATTQSQISDTMLAKAQEFAINAGATFQGSLSTPFSEEMNLMLQDFLTKIQEMELRNDQFKNNLSLPSEQILTANQAFWQGFYSGFDKGAKSIEQRARQLGTQVQGAISQGFANGFAAMGAALVNGENMFKAFSGALLSSFGDVLIMLGQQTLAVGILMQAVPFLFGLQGAAAIAAGIGMMIAGGALKAVGSNISAANRGAAKTSSSIGAPSEKVPVVGVGELGTLGQISETPSEEMKKRSATVNITIEGNVFDRRETGLQIAEIIRESFDSEGVIVGGVA